jgi:uncharacterized protein (DUF779 family)
VIALALLPLRRAHEPVIRDDGWSGRQGMHSRPMLMPRAEHLIQDGRLDLGELVGGVISRSWQINS